MQIKRVLVFLLVIGILASLSYIYPNFTGKTISQDYPKETAILERVIDGDTLEAKVGEETWTIRLLGINTPEKNMPFSTNAKEFLKQFENKTIILERDRENIDKYKRKLRYIFYETQFLNLKIIENGWANTYYLEKLKYEKELSKAEDNAQNQELGIWTKSKETCSNCISLLNLNAINESFTIKNNCGIYCSLESWFVKDLGRNVFYLTPLESSQEQTYYSKNSANVWNNDADTLFIFDKTGKLVLFYEYDNSA